MAIVNGSVELGYKNTAWFTANPTLILLVGQIVYLEQTGTYKLGDGVTALSALSFLGTPYTLTTAEIGTVINGASSATPNDTDLVMSVDASVAKKNTWTQIKAFLKTYYDTVFESLSNKSSSYTVSSTTTYANTKALVDGLATKGAGTILGFLGTTGTGKQIAFNSGTANTITGSDFVTAYNVGATTAIILANTSTSQVQGLSMYEGANGGFINRYGSAFTATYYAGTSLPKANTLTLESANALNFPIVVLGFPGISIRILSGF